MARAEAAVVQRSSKKKQKRDQVSREERQGLDARQKTLGDLKQKQAAIEARKRKASPSPSASKKQKKRKKRGSDSADDDGDADDESGASASAILSMESTEPAAEASKTAAEPSEPVEAETVEDGGLNSDVDGDDADSEDWYTETDPAAEIESTIAVREQMEGGGVATDVVADDERLSDAKAKLTRDWEVTTSNWDVLTKVEMDVLAQDAAALKKMRVDGWNLDPSSHPVRTEPYPGLFNGDYSPTDAVLARSESPLKLFFFFMPPKLWIKIASESNRYYNQHLNERVDRMYQKKVAQDDEVTRDAVLPAETKRHKKTKAKETA
ncbi:hypothetical protein PF010_g6648 [Phytophthora fragariae]|uniref:Uncharacterized protein n=2 Tax=Phytophthora fragariae TaxID=53985 RepID=A0A6A3ZXR7_9STRA|nr:hypothetical protein PF010_g6648 [Phytophthora fragariae]KAE9243335.1 hypothetical protein PF002_g8313 [Phytophthora fragariae]